MRSYLSLTTDNIEIVNHVMVSMKNNYTIKNTMEHNTYLDILIIVKIYSTYIFKIIIYIYIYIYIYMSKDKDFLEFKSTCDEVGRQLDYDCGWDLGVKDIFRDIVSDAGNLVFSRNRKIAELEKKKKKIT